MNPRKTNPKGGAGRKVRGTGGGKAAAEAAEEHVGAVEDIAPDVAVSEDVAPQLEPDAGGEGERPAPTEVISPEQAASGLEQELLELRERHLRSVAEYENFRKRTAREKQQMWARAQAEIVSCILDSLDDFGRVLDLDHSQARAEDVVKGVELVERKMVRELERAGLERVGELGEVFDPNHHEAIGSLPAESEEQDHTVGAVLQLGYKFGGTLVRPAKVQVAMWQGSETPETDE